MVKSETASENAVSLSPPPMFSMANSIILAVLINQFVVPEGFKIFIESYSYLYSHLVHPVVGRDG